MTAILRLIGCLSSSCTASERAWKAGKQRSTYGRYQYAHLPAGVLGTPRGLRGVFLLLDFLLFCWVVFLEQPSHISLLTD